MNTLTVRIPNSVRRDLEKLAREENRPVSEIVRESVRRYVAVQRFQALRRKTLPYAEAQGFLTDEDVFKAVS